MQISGRLIIVVMFALAIAMSGGAWLYQYSYSRHSAEFWGPAGSLIVKSPELQLLELAPADSPAEGEDAGAEVDLSNQVAGRNVVDHHDLRKKPGLIHLRHVFTQDSNFVWDERSVEPVDGGKREWAYAVRFVDGEAEQIVLFTRDFELMGKLSADGATVEVLPCARMAGAVTTYLRDVGALERNSNREVPSP
ncbi:hypothetical protein [Lacipirellula parvula]|uniref:Uncharacterized protein n=1 Tax=Lacipirellula parvula TaxID=2650471 RepID=A0A5K7XMY2_9BACT|nr:hypothetical protein [Lacipirellula parvula]BBO36286.1 hypothetical protein PLANPX_5898 [Lacipirellula parvula]